MTQDTRSTADGQLLAIVERIERLTGEKKAIGDDIKDVYAEAKSAGYDVKALKAIVKERSTSSVDTSEHEAILDTYRRALGMLDGTPLGNAAVQRATAPASRAGGAGGGGRSGGAGTTSNVRMAG
jgi:uncharacterized protein (UPF0335 family)